MSRNGCVEEVARLDAGDRRHVSAFRIPHSDFRIPHSDIRHTYGAPLLPGLTLGRSPRPGFHAGA